MAVPVETSITLLHAIADNPGSGRWTEFFRAYEPLMRGYLAANFKTVDVDDVIQETMIALVKALPGYRYNPNGCQRFRNYLIGVLKHKAVDIMRREVANGRPIPPELLPPPGNGDQEWREVVFEAAVEQLMQDEDVSPRNREIFRHVSLMHEAPEKVAAEFGITRNNLYVIEKRMVDRLAGIAKRLAEGFNAR